MTKEQCDEAKKENPEMKDEDCVIDANSVTYSLIPPMIPHGNEGSMTKSYKQCQRNIKMRWAWGFSASVYNGHTEYESGVGGIGIWQTDGLLVGPVDASSFISGTENETVDWLIAEACIEQSPQAPHGLLKSELANNPEWRREGAYMAKLTIYKKITACEPAKITPPTWPAAPMPAAPMPAAPTQPASPTYNMPR